jgi:retron-type reverse transcriptase
MNKSTTNMLEKQIFILRNALDMAMTAASEANVQHAYYLQLKNGWAKERTELLAEIAKLKKKIRNGKPLTKNGKWGEARP